MPVRYYEARETHPIRSFTRTLGIRVFDKAAPQWRYVVACDNILVGLMLPNLTTQWRGDCRFCRSRALWSFLETLLPSSSPGTGPFMRSRRPFPVTRSSLSPPTG